MDATNGELLWSHVTGDAIGLSAVIANGYVFAGPLDHSVYAFHFRG